MKWVAISGSWRHSSPELEKDVRGAITDVMTRGDGVVTGGALGVDFIATEQVLTHNPTAERIKIIIPTPLDVYAAHYRKRAEEGVITSFQAEELIGILMRVIQRNRDALQELDHKKVDVASYYDRNTQVIAASDELLAFQVNGSEGTQDTIDKARAVGLPVVTMQYRVDV